MEKLRIIVGGFLGLMPAGGVTWDYIQYPLGLSELGHDVFYIEDTRLYPLYQSHNKKWDDCSTCVKHLQQVMDYFGMGNRWAYRDEASGECFGFSEEKIRELCKTADVFINVSCSTYIRDEYAAIPVRILIDTDPMFTQIQYLFPKQMVIPGYLSLTDLINCHNYHFTFGENIGGEDCRIPDCNLNWIRTRQPVCLKYWNKQSLPAVKNYFTTLMNWTERKKLNYQNEEWGQKDEEFIKIIGLPKQLPDFRLSLVVNQTFKDGGIFPKDAILQNKWNLLDPLQHASDWKDYQRFIKESSGEFSIAKNTYVKARTGWFSCRSACYLASGRPIIAQDTAWSKIIPIGKGIFAFTNISEAVEALAKVAADYSTHANAARNIAQEYFDSKKVLHSLLSSIN